MSGEQLKCLAWRNKDLVAMPNNANTPKGVNVCGSNS